MQQKCIIKNLVSPLQVEELAQKLRLIESRLFLSIVYCIKSGDQTRAHMLAHEILYVRHLKAHLQIK